jgi:lipid A 3-O-deacylase
MKQASVICPRLLWTKLVCVCFTCRDWTSLRSDRLNSNYGKTALANVILTIRRCALWRAAALWAWIIVGSVLYATPGYCQDRVAVETGVGNFVDVVGIGVDSAEWKRWSVGQDWSLSLYGLGRVSFWRGRADHSRDEHMVDIGAAPVLHLEESSAREFTPYLEASVGLNLLSQTRINESRQFSTAFQFGEFLGLGATFGEKRRYDVALRVEHVSNGGIKKPNDGLTYGALVFQYRIGQR